jgi:signal transduction histidine kinase
MSPKAELYIFRIVQEVLNNAVIHPGAIAAKVSILTHQKLLYFTVRDNGRSFDQEMIHKPSRSPGLRKMKDCMASFNVKFETATTSPGGTKALN